MTPDPLGGDITNPQSLNRYAYVLNNPTTFTDPLGLGNCDALKPNEVGYCGNNNQGGYCDPNDITGQWPCNTPLPPGTGSGGISIGIGVPIGGGPCNGEACPSGGLNWPIIGAGIGAGFAGVVAAVNAQGSPPAPNAGTANPNTLPPHVAACEVPVLNAINKVFGTNFSGAFPGTFYNGAANLFVTGTNLTAAQFNAISALGRFPLNPISYLIGYGPTLHITGPGFFDQQGVFANSNVGGSTSVLFTAHLDSAYAYNPIGLLLHLLIDVLDKGAFRAACP